MTDYDEEEVEKFLEHFGVLGMHWGIRHDPEKKGRRPGKGDVGSLAEAKKQQFEEHSRGMEEKYGKGSLSGKGEQPAPKEKQGFHLTPLEKKIMIGAGIAVGVAAAGYGAHKFISGSTPEEHAVKSLERASKLDIFRNQGLVRHWKDGVDLPKGSIIQRASTELEKDIRPDGFYAAFEPNDIQRYKAGLPIWWEHWGFGKTDGYMTQIQALKGVKAPTGEQTFNTYKSILGDDDLKNAVSRTILGRNADISKMTAGQRDRAMKAVARQQFNGFTVDWTPGRAANNPQVGKFFDEIKKQGYNALIDFNDSGNLADLPIRTLNGGEYKVVGNAPVSRGEIETLQKNLGVIYKKLAFDGVRFPALKKIKEAVSHINALFDQIKWEVNLANFGSDRKSLERLP